MSDMKHPRKALGQLEYPPEIREKLEEVTELPDDPDQQVEFFDKVQTALTTRLRDDS